jgi:fumarate reductase flavoprotein subunit
VKGIQDSKELFYQETLKGGNNKNNPQLLRRFVENAPQAIEWLAVAALCSTISPPPAG